MSGYTDVNVEPAMEAIQPMLAPLGEREASRARTTLEAMLTGSPKLSAVADGMKLSSAQAVKLRAYKLAIVTYRDVIRPLFGRRSSPDFEGLTDLKLRARNEVRQDAAHPHALSQAEVECFQREGLIGPFDVLPPEEALELGRQCQARLDDDFVQNSIMSPEQVNIARQCPDWSIRKAGFFQAWRVPELFELMTAPQIGQRLASLLGDDVLLWRSQFFEKKPGERGTFWHQTITFREADLKDKLVPPKNLDPGMSQLSVWVALREATVKNGTLMMLPGSFQDARIEQMYAYAAGNKLEFFADLPPEQMETVLKVGLLHNCQFTKIQALFDASLSLLGQDFFEGREVRPITMKPGQAVIFTSLNMHASYPNATADDIRLSAVGRYTPGDAKLLRNGQVHLIPTTHAGDLKCPMDHIPAIQVHGKHSSGLNAVIDRPLESLRPPAS